MSSQGPRPDDQLAGGQAHPIDAVNPESFQVPVRSLF